MDEEDTHNKLVAALKEALHDDSPDRPILVARIPVICNDIRFIKDALVRQSNDMKWMKWIGGGFVSAAGLLALKSLGI